MQIVTQFGSEQAGGIAALGLNLQGFLFQLITFCLVLLLLRKFAYGKLVDTLESRRQAVISSLEDARKAADELAKTSETTRRLLDQARGKAADIVETAHKEAARMVEVADAKAEKRAAHIIETAEARIKQEAAALRQAIRGEALELVTKTTEKILRSKLDAKADAELISQTLKEMK